MSGDKYFVHINGLIDPIVEGNTVTFELERGPKGMNAVNVKLEREKPAPAKEETPEEGKDSENDAAE